MYSKHFGLREPGFSIVPDPHYLFLGRQHQEALAHLLYGAGESGGFVLLTGEVGTGKTTVCRAFLEQLPEGVDVALIVNPALTAQDLLRAICAEFQIELPPGERSLKVLVDHLNAYLLDAHARGRHPLLIIDEAQNLRPRVLEQIRLLTNLETSRHKLLQVFLIGQPELRRLLARDSLRQLDQRITARFHLRPFDQAETLDYIRHRLRVAGGERALLTPAAMRRVHRLTGGVPRLINILCDRALLGACVTGASRVDRAIVERAARELWDQPKWHLPLSTVRPTLQWLALFALAFWLGWLGWLGYQWLWPLLEQEVEVAEQAEVIESPPPVDLAQWALPLDAAWPLLLTRWGLEMDWPEGRDPCADMGRLGLACERDQGDLETLRAVDRPALLEMRAREGAPKVLVLVAIEDGHLLIEHPDGARHVPSAALASAWNGRFHMLWQPPPVGTQVIKADSSGEAVRWLRRLLSEVPELGVTEDDSPLFDEQLREALRTFQRAQGLEPDGIAGPRTLIRLHNAVNLPGVPHLQPAPVSDPAPQAREEQA
ncbi:MAG: AAA family ATPase [Chromatiaceae bacterium]|nr:AAA family ATPase [Chromatiaceae bacterium]